MLIEVLTLDNPRFVSRSLVTKVPWLHISNKANVDTSLSELQCLNYTDIKQYDNYDFSKMCCTIYNTCTIAFHSSFIFIVNLILRFLILYLEPCSPVWCFPWYTLQLLLFVHDCAVCFGVFLQETTSIINCYLTVELAIN